MPVRTIEDPPLEQHYTVPEFCALFRVSKSQANRIIHAGAIAIVDVALSGDKIQARIPESEIKRWRRENYIPARRTA